MTLAHEVGIVGGILTKATDRKAAIEKPCQGSTRDDAVKGTVTGDPGRGFRGSTNKDFTRLAGLSCPA